MSPDLPRNTDVCVVVRMFNEAETVGAVVSELRPHFPHVVCVDDGSTDGCDRIALAAGATVVSHPVNLGGGAALQTGFDYALKSSLVQFVVTFDADGQHRVSDALELLALARRERVDFVVGSRFIGAKETQIPPVRRLVLKAGTVFTRATTGIKLTDAHNGLRVMNRRALESMSLSLNSMAYASQLLSRVVEHDLTYREAPVTILYTDYSRRRGQSNVNALNIAFDLAVERLRGAR